MTAEVKDQIVKCFEEMSEAHEAIKKVYKSAVKLVPTLSSKGMGVFLEALALGTPDILDTRVVNILQDARLNRRLREEVKTTDNVSLFDKCKEMLPDWMHPIFKQKVKYWPVGKMPTETVTSSSQPPELLETIDLCSSNEGEKMEEGDIAKIPTVVQLRKEPTTEVPLADDNDDESSSSLEDDPDDDDDDGEDLCDIEELQEIYEEHLTGQPKEVKPMEEGWAEMDTSKATEEPVKLVKLKAAPTKQKTTPMVKVKKSECPRVEKSTVPTFHIPEPVMTRAREKVKMLGE